MSDVTRILCAIDQGDPAAAEQLLPLVYEELRRLAAQKLSHEKPGQTLQATALVHEAYIRLVGTSVPIHRTVATSSPPQRRDAPDPGRGRGRSRRDEAAGCRDTGYRTCSPRPGHD